MPNYMTELSPDNNAHVYQIKDKEAAPIDLLKDTVGWVGKNLLKINNTSQTLGGITYTVNSDGSVKANGTAAGASNFILAEYVLPEGDYIASKGYSSTPSTHCGLVVEGYNGSTWVKVLASSYSTDEQSFSVDYVGYDRIRVTLKIDQNDVVSNLMIYPMIRDASIIDDTYEPYHKSVEEVVEQVYVDNGILGAHQWLDVSKDPISYHTTLSVSGHSIRLQSTSQTWGNVSYKLTTLPKNTKFNLRCNASITSGAALIALRGKVTGGSDVVIREISVSEGAFDAEFNTSNYDEITIGFYCTDSTTTTADITYGDILLKLASDMSNDVTDYAMTNRELTEMLPTEYSTNGLTYTDNCSLVAGGYFKLGKIVFVNIRVLTSGTGNIVIDGFPTYNNKTINSKNICPCKAYNMTDDSVTNYYATINSGGRLVVIAPTIANKEYAISGVYLCD